MQDRHCCFWSDPFDDNCGRLLACTGSRCVLLPHVHDSSPSLLLYVIVTPQSLRHSFCMRSNGGVELQRELLPVPIQCDPVQRFHRRVLHSLSPWARLCELSESNVLCIATTFRGMRPVAIPEGVLLCWQLLPSHSIGFQPLPDRFLTCRSVVYPVHGKVVEIQDEDHETRMRTGGPLIAVDAQSKQSSISNQFVLLWNPVPAVFDRVSLLQVHALLVRQSRRKAHTIAGLLKSSQSQVG